YPPAPKALLRKKNSIAPSIIIRMHLIMRALQPLNLSALIDFSTHFRPSIHSHKSYTSVAVVYKDAVPSLNIYQINPSVILKGLTFPYLYVLEDFFQRHMDF